MTILKRCFVALLVMGLLFVSARMLERNQKADFQKKGSLPRFRAEILPLFSCGHSALLADLLVARGLSFFGANRLAEDKSVFDGLADLFSQAFKLDPENRDLILFGANTLVGTDLMAAVSLLELGMRHHPQYWKFPELVGFIYYYHVRDSVMAARYYEQAARLPDHPPFVPSISSKLYEESGFFEQAIAVLRNLAEGSRDEKVRQGFEERVQQIEDRLRLRRFRVPVELQSVMSATRIGLEMRRFNPYPELESGLLLDLSWQVPDLGESERAIMASVWQQRLGGEIWMQLRTDDEGQLVWSGEAVLGALQGDGGEDLVEKLMQHITNQSTLSGGSPWPEHAGQVVRVCGILKEVREENGDLILIWLESDLPPVRIAAVNRENFAPENWPLWLEDRQGLPQAVSALLTISFGNEPALLVSHPAQIRACSDQSDQVLPPAGAR